MLLSSLSILLLSFFHLISFFLFHSSFSYSLPHYSLSVPSIFPINLSSLRLFHLDSTPLLYSSLLINLSFLFFLSQYSSDLSFPFSALFRVFPSSSFPPPSLYVSSLFLVNLSLLRPLSLPHSPCVFPLSFCLSSCHFLHLSTFLPLLLSPLFSSPPFLFIIYYLSIFPSPFPTPFLINHFLFNFSFLFLSFSLFLSFIPLLLPTLSLSLPLYLLFYGLPSRFPSLLSGFLLLS